MRPLRDARPVSLYTIWYPVPKATRATLGFGFCPSFKGHSLSPPCKSLTLRFATFASSLYPRSPVAPVCVCTGIQVKTKNPCSLMPNFAMHRYRY
jgi:hypothetical protein